MKLIISLVLLTLITNLNAQDLIVKNCKNQTYIVDSIGEVTYGPVERIRKVKSNGRYIVKDSTGMEQLFDFELNLVNDQYWKSIEFYNCKQGKFFIVHGQDIITGKTIYQIMNFDGVIDTTLKILQLQREPWPYNKLELQLLDYKYYSYDGAKTTEIKGFSERDEFYGSYGSAGSRGRYMLLSLPKELESQGYEITKSLDTNKRTLRYGMKYNGELILENKYLDIEYIGNSSKNPLFIVKENFKFGLINNQGKVILPENFQSITRSLDENIIANVKKCHRSISYLILDSKNQFKLITAPE